MFRDVSPEAEATAKRKTGAGESRGTFGSVCALMLHQQGLLPDSPA